ncbi:MAG: hypothetical protein ABUL54_09045, partial [Dongia sp.]
SLSTVYWPIAWPSPELVTLTVFSGRSRLRLPVRPERAEDAVLPAFGEPIQAPNTPHEKREVASPLRRTVTRDLLTGTITVDFPRWVGEKVMTDIDQTFISSAYVRHIIREGDPLSARTETDYKVTLKRKDTEVTHHSKGTLTCDADYFHVAMEMEVFEKDRSVFKRRWDEKIKRDFM